MFFSDPSVEKYNSVADIRIDKVTEFCLKHSTLSLVTYFSEWSRLEQTESIVKVKKTV